MGPTHLDPQPELPHGADRNFGLDLLRAGAILLVMISHYANNVSLWFGWPVAHRIFFAGDLGVELFFALSGFLIGRILLQTAELEPGWTDLGIFLVRRWMRTLPLYFVCLAGLFAFFPPAPQHAVSYALRFTTLSQNLLQPIPNDYFFAASWSLTVEEWFYFLFTTIFFCLIRLVRRPSVALWLCLGLFIAGPLALRLAPLGFDDASFGYSKEVFFRIDEIAYGVMFAWLFLRRSVLFRHPWLTLMAGCALVAAIWAGYTPLPLWLRPALTYNLTVIGCALFLPGALWLRQGPEWFAVPVRRLSAQSYDLYLMHLPILVDFVRARIRGAGRLGPFALAIMAVALPFLLSAASFHWFEAPILRRRPEERRRRAIAPSGSAAACA